MITFNKVSSHNRYAMPLSALLAIFAGLSESHAQSDAGELLEWGYFDIQNVYSIPNSEPGSIDEFSTCTDKAGRVHVFALVSKHHQILQHALLDPDSQQPSPPPPAEVKTITKGDMLNYGVTATEAGVCIAWCDNTRNLAFSRWDEPHRQWSPASPGPVLTENTIGLGKPFFFPGDGFLFWPCSHPYTLDSNEVGRLQRLATMPATSPERQNLPYAIFSAIHGGEGVIDLYRFTQGDGKRWSTPTTLLRREEHKLARQMDECRVFRDRGDAFSIFVECDGILGAEKASGLRRYVYHAAAKAPPESRGAWEPISRTPHFHIAPVINDDVYFIFGYGDMENTGSRNVVWARSDLPGQYQVLDRDVPCQSGAISAAFRCENGQRWGIVMWKHSEDWITAFVLLGDKWSSPIKVPTSASSVGVSLTSKYRGYLLLNHDYKAVGAFPFHLNAEKIKKLAGQTPSCSKPRPSETRPQAGEVERRVNER